MAGMLYLPRLFVYHADTQKGSAQSETFKVMERRLLRAIINPAMIASWVFGLWLAWKGFGFQGGWLHGKIAAVVAMSGVHGYLSGAVRKFAEDRNTKPARHWRIVNEVPTVLMIVIVILVIVKPF
jgi:putative membrane protein